MSEWTRVSDEELHAFIDGEIDDPRRAQIDEIVSQDVRLSQRIATFRSDKAMLRDIYGGLIDRPLPKAWLSMIEEGTRRRRFSFPLPAMAAIAATVVAVLFGATLYRQALPPRKDDIIAEALAARNDAVAPRVVEAVAMNSAAPNNEVATALNMRVKAPDLGKMGYRLARLQIYGGVPGGQAVELVYRGSENRSFTLYLRRSTTAPRFDQFQAGGIRVCIWQDDVLGTVMAGKMSAAEMQRLASLAYNGLTS